MTTNVGGPGKGQPVALSRNLVDELLDAASPTWQACHTFLNQVLPATYALLRSLYDMPGWFFQRSSHHESITNLFLQTIFPSGLRPSIQVALRL